MADDNKTKAAEAKDKGNKCFAQKNREGYNEALVHYEEAIALDPENHVFYANKAACHIELGSDEWEPKKKVEAYAHALIAAQKCTSLNATWAKGFIRQSTAEFELIAATQKLEDRKKQDEKWAKEDAEREQKDPEAFKGIAARTEKDYAIDPSLVEIVAAASYANCEIACRKGLELEVDNQPLRNRLQALRDAGHATDEANDRELRRPEVAAPFKAEGNKLFAAKKWKDAADQYTKALEQDPFDHVFFSNRSACYAEDQEYDKALVDAERCVSLKPDFVKGYSRLCVALYHLGRYVDMEEAAKKGVAIDASNASLQELLKQAQAETCEPLAVQKHMHQLREEKRKDQKLQDLLQGLNMGGNGVQMFTPGSLGGAGDLSSLFGGGGGMGGMGGFGGSGKARMTEAQMRGMARAMAQAPTNAESSSTAHATMAETPKAADSSL